MAHGGELGDQSNTDGTKPSASAKILTLKTGVDT